MKIAPLTEDTETFSVDLDSRLLAHHPRFRRLLKAAEERYQ